MNLLFPQFLCFNLIAKGTKSPYIPPQLSDDNYSGELKWE